MRQELITYTKTLALGNFSVSSELPREESGTAMYLKNPKVLYFAQTEFNEEPLIDTLNGPDVHELITSVTLYFAADGKNLPANYDTLVSSLRAGKDINTTQGYTKRECIVSSEFEADMLVTQLEYRFTKLT